MKDPILVVLAAGMGSRFGGLKQLTPVGPSGEFLIDYSVYDAVSCGVNKVIFVIRKEHEQLFKETIGKRIEKIVPDKKYTPRVFDELFKKNQSRIRKEKSVKIKI